MQIVDQRKNGTANLVDTVNMLISHSFDKTFRGNCNISCEEVDYLDYITIPNTALFPVAQFLPNEEGERDGSRLNLFDEKGYLDAAIEYAGLYEQTFYKSVEICVVDDNVRGHS